MMYTLVLRYKVTPEEAQHFIPTVSEPLAAQQALNMSAWDKEEGMVVRADTSLPCSDQAVPLLQVVRLVRRTGDWEACRDECNMEEQCEMFKFKVTLDKCSMYF